MRDFNAIHQELGLKKFCESPLGTLYFVPSRPGSQRVMVRRFDSELPASLANSYADFIQATQHWLERRTELSRLVRVLQPIEVGKDFVARPHLSYYTSTSTYVTSDDPPEIPEALEEMRNAFRAAIGTSADPREDIIEAVLARSLLEPSGKTVFFESEGRFVVVEPKPTREELERWAALTASASN
jgi:hypothetical protein